MPVTQTIVSKREALRCKFQVTNKQTVSAPIHLAVEWKNWLLQTRRSLHNSRRRWARVCDLISMHFEWLNRDTRPSTHIFCATAPRLKLHSHVCRDVWQPGHHRTMIQSPACVQWSTFLWNKSWRCADRFVSWAFALASPAAADSIHWSSELLTQWLDSSRPREEKYWFCELLPQSCKIET